MRTRRYVVICAATLALAACSNGDPNADPTPSGPPDVTTVVSPTPPMCPGGGPSKERDNFYAEAGEKYGLPTAKVEAAVLATRAEMVRVGGTAGERLQGHDNKPKPLDQSGHFDPGILAYFAGQLGVPVDKAHDVMNFLLDEWNEYDEQAEQNNPGGYQRLITKFATTLKVSPARSAWFMSLMISRPAVPDATVDPVEKALATAAGMTVDEFLKATRK